jgi:PAS domain S-box-containing protein
MDTRRNCSYRLFADTNNLDVMNSYFEMLNAHASKIREAWVTLLQRQDRFRDGPLLPMVQQELDAGVDLFSLWLRVFAEGGSALDVAANRLVEKVRRDDYSISDLLTEVTCLRRCVEQVLDLHACTSNDGVGLSGLYHPLEEVFGACLERTSFIYESVLEGCSRGYCQLDEEGKIVYANSAFKQISAFADARGHLLADLFPENRTFIGESLGVGGANQPVVQRMLLKRADDCRVTVSAEVGRMELHDATCGGYAVLSDVSKLVEAEEKVYQSLDEGVIRVDLDNIVRYANSAAEAMLDRLVGRNILELFPDDENRAILTDQIKLREQGEGAIYDVTYYHRGRALQLHVTAMPQFDTVGQRLGTLATFRNVGVVRASDKIHRIIADAHHQHDILDDVLKVVKGLIPFDLATVGVYSHDLGFWRAIHYFPRPDPMWETNWFSISQQNRDWIQSDVPQIVDNLSKFVDQDPKLAEDPTIKRLIKEGCESFVVLPIRGEKRVLATVSLISKQANFYDEKDYALLREIPLEKAVRVALAVAERGENRFLDRLFRCLNNYSNSKQVAEELVKSLSGFYKWQCVTIIKVNEVRRKLELFAQHPGPENGFRLPANWEQDFGKGIIGKVHRTGNPINQGNVQSDDNYLVASEKTRSELCVPFNMHGESFWLLNIEDSRINAFADPDIKTVERIVVEVESFLNNLFTHTTLDEIFRIATDGVLITDLNGHVVRANPAALEMLGVTEKDIKNHPPLADFIVDSGIADTFSEMNQIAPCDVGIKKKSGERFKARVTGSVLPEEYGRRVYFIEDSLEKERVAGLQAYGDILYSNAGQAKMPLAMVSGILHRLQRGASESVQDTVAKAMAYLRRVELNYDRLMLYGEGTATGDSSFLCLDFNSVLLRAQADLPESEREEAFAIPSIAADLPPVWADSYKLNFVLLSIFNYLLELNPLDGKIGISAVEDAVEEQGGVLCRILGAGMQGYEGANAPADPLDRSRIELALGETLLRRFIERDHHGQYRRRVDADGRSLFELFLPAGDCRAQT